MRIKAFNAALPYTLPVFMGYLFLGIAFGVLLQASGYSLIWAFFMSLFIYAGSGQFVAVTLLVSPFNLLSAAFITFMVNARHIFYGLSLLDKFKEMGHFKPYMIFSLTDETYSLLCQVQPPKDINKKWFYFFIALLDQSYWIFGSCLGVLAGTLINFDSTGIEFTMTTLFVVIFVEQWESSKNHIPALLGLVATLSCRIIFGVDSFLIFSMILIFIGLTLLRPREDSK